MLDFFRIMISDRKRLHSVSNEARPKQKLLAQVEASNPVEQIRTIPTKFFVVP